jgi:hypothetical protein
MFISKYTKVFFTSLIFLLISLCVYADPGFPDDNPDPGGEVNTPIDGGASLLVAAAALYGYKRMKGKGRKDV